MNYGHYNPWGQPPMGMSPHGRGGPGQGMFGPSRYGNITVVDKVLPDMLHTIDDYWYQFPPMNPLWHSILAFVVFWFLIISLMGNGIVISVFMSTKTLRTPANLLVVNLALSDFLMMFCMGPPLIINSYYETWSFGPFACELYGMIGSLFGCGSIWTMTMIALDRHTVIVKGFAAKPLTFKGAFLRILWVWGFSGLWTVIPMFGWNRYVPEGNMTACGLDYLTRDWFHKSYILVYAGACYFLPLFLIIYSYFFIVQAVFEHEQQMKEQAKKMNVTSLRSVQGGNNTSAEVKLAKIALMTITLWFMAWTPYLVINFTGVFEGAKISPLATIWGSVFAKAMAIYNPIVYGISHPKYRAALQKKYPSLACATPVDKDDEMESRSQVTTAQMEDLKSNA